MPVFISGLYGLVAKTPALFANPRRRPGFDSRWRQLFLLKAFASTLTSCTLDVDVEEAQKLLPAEAEVSEWLAAG